VRRAGVAIRTRQLGTWGAGPRGRWATACGPSTFNDAGRRKLKTMSSRKDSGRGGHSCSMRRRSVGWKPSAASGAADLPRRYLAEPSACSPWRLACPPCCMQHTEPHAYHTSREPRRKPHQLEPAAYTAQDR
jgi:hypothetical protein